MHSRRAHVHTSASCTQVEVNIKELNIQFPRSHSRLFHTNTLPHVIHKGVLYQLEESPYQIAEMIIAGVPQVAYRTSELCRNPTWLKLVHLLGVADRVERVA
jgi:hypothetical protein